MNGENKLKDQICNLRNNIEKKESELIAMRSQLSDLEKQLRYSRTNFLIKVSDSCVRLSSHICSDDIMIDLLTDENGNIFARSAHERREYSKEVFEKYLDNHERTTICTCSDEALNVIGELIDKNKIIPNDIEVVLYNDENPNGLICHYNYQGYLDNWPIGALF